MKTERLVNLFFFIGILSHQFLFWKEQMGINSLLFSGLMIGFLYLLYNKEGSFSKEAKAMAAGTLFTAVLVVVHNSGISKVLHLISFIAFVGFVQQRELRFLGYGFLLGLTNIFETPKKVIHQLVTSENPNGHFAKGLRYFKIGVIPFLVLSVFYLLYFVANPKFAQLSSSFWNNFIWLFQWDVSFFRFLFLLVSIFICGGILFKTQIQSFLHRQQNQTSDLVRKRRPKGLPHTTSPIALKNEYNAGLFLIFALNVLLLVVNLTDIAYVWFGFDQSSPQNLKIYVHEGTWILIFAIILAMGVLLYFFRKNLNFYPNRKYLLLGAYIWILQNILLTFSVAIRNYRYIDFHGLAYKRIGVIFFLLLVFYGLWTMYIKVKTHKSLYFLVSKNTWAVYAILLLCSSINWDVVITKYNLNVPTKGAVDVGFMLYTVSDKNLYLLKEHSNQLEHLESYPVVSDDLIDRYLQRKEKTFLNKMKKRTWRSWNFSDHRNLKYLTKQSYGIN